MLFQSFLYKPTTVKTDHINNLRTTISFTNSNAMINHSHFVFSAVKITLFHKSLKPSDRAVGAKKMFAKCPKMYHCCTLGQCMSKPTQVVFF